MPLPNAADFATYFGRYIKLVPEEEILPALRGENERTLAFLRRIPASEEGVCHPPYTWTIRQVVGHMIDAERIFAYRALRFARGDCTPLASFDELEYVQQAYFDRRRLADLADEWEAVRRANLYLFASFSEEIWLRRGTASSQDLSVRGLAYAILGHERHHTTILRSRVPSAA
jgi:uncharacterized damage-inducible protein DinB